MRLEAGSCSNYLNKELIGPLAAGCEDAGEGAVNGSTRRKVIEQREGLRHEVLIKAPKQHPDREARPTTVFRNFDKLSGAWLLAVPGPQSGLSSRVFGEAMAAHLCLPFAAVVSSGWVGQSIGTKVDCFGDAIMCSNQLPGDAWRTRHDTLKMDIAYGCLVSSLPYDVEVYELFADLLPASVIEEGGQLEWVRARQGLVPDFRLRLPTAEGPSDCLAELKVVITGVSWFPRGVEGRGTNRRASLLQGLYKSKLARYDQQFHGVERGQIGPLVRRLDSFEKLESLVVGPWGEGSKDFHTLLKTLAETQLAAKARSRWREGSDNELGYLLGQKRRMMSVCAVRAQSLCLLARLCHLGQKLKKLQIG